MNNDDLLAYINEELITNNSSKNELSDDIYTNYIKSENNKNVNSTLDMAEKNKIALAQASLLNSITNNVYNPTLPLSPPQDDINSPNSEIYLNSQNVSSNPVSLSNSPSMELEALSPSSMGSEVEIKTEDPNLVNLTQIYQNNGLLTNDGLINPSLISLSANPEFIDNNALLNAMCSDNTKSPLFPQVLPNSNISIPTTSYINDALNPLSTVNISLPTNDNIPVSLNTNITLPTVTVPSNPLEFTVPSNALSLNSTMATTAALDINSLQTLTPLAMNGPLAIANVNTAMNPSSVINSSSTPALASVKSETTTTSSSSPASTATATTTNNTTTSSITTKAPLSATLDLTSIKSSVNETLELTKKLSQSNGSVLKEGNSIDVTDILKSDVAASCLNLLKGSKGKPGRKKKCLQSPSDANNANATSATTSSTAAAINNSKTFPLLNALNANNDKNATGAVVNPLLASQSVKFPIIKPKASSTDNHTPILPLAPATTKSSSINCFNNNASKPLSSNLVRPTPILPNGSTEKSNTNNANANPVKTAYQKRQERLLKNREAAHLSRKRKREQLHMLETHAQELIAENQTLKLKVIELEQLNEKLVKENKLLKMNMNLGDVQIKKEPEESMMTDIPSINTSTEMPNDIYNLYIKPEALTPVKSETQNKSSTKSKEIGIVFMVLLFSFSLFTFPLSIFSSSNSNEVSRNLISTFMNKISDFSLASVSSVNTGKILSNTYEQEKPYLLDSGHYELADTQVQSAELEVRRRNMDNVRKEKGQLSQFKKSRKMKNGSHTKSKQKRNTTRKNIKKNYEYTSFSEISSLMSVFHPKNVDLDEESLKQMSLLQHWIVEGFCSIHENHTYAKDPSNVKDIIKVYNAEDNNERGSTDLTVKKNGNNYYDNHKSYSKEIPYNMKQFIKFYPDTTYFYSPKLVQLFPLSTNDILEPSVPIIDRLQYNDTTAEKAVSDESKNIISPSNNTSYYKKNVNEDKNHQNEPENKDNDNVYQLPFTNKPKMAIITNIETDDIDEDSNSYLMIDFEIKGARLIENE
jgi:hypothetical protein